MKDSWSIHAASIASFITPCKLSNKVRNKQEIKACMTQIIFHTVLFTTASFIFYKIKRDHFEITLMIIKKQTTSIPNYAGSFPAKRDYIYLSPGKKKWYLYESYSLLACCKNSARIGRGFFEFFFINPPCMRMIFYVNYDSTDGTNIC
jgi:hypothetical protein